MAFRLRRGTNTERQTQVLVQGELIYVTDYLTAGVSPLWIGDGETPGGREVQTGSGSPAQLTQNLDLNGNNIFGNGSITATSFFGDGSGLTNLPPITSANIEELNNVVISSPINGDALVYEDGVWINSAVAGGVGDGVVEGSNYRINIVAADSSLLVDSDNGQINASAIFGFVPDASISSTSVTQHESLITISESQISDFGDYVLSNELGNFSFIGRIIDTSDSSDIIITPAVTMSSDLTVENDLRVLNKLVVNTIEVENLITSSSGTPEIVSDSDLLLSANTNIIGTANNGNISLTANSGSLIASSNIVDITAGTNIVNTATGGNILWTANTGNLISSSNAVSVTATSNIVNTSNAGNISLTANSGNINASSDVVNITAGTDIVGIATGGNISWTANSGSINAVSNTVNVTAATNIIGTATSGNITFNANTGNINANSDVIDLTANTNILGTATSGNISFTADSGSVLISGGAISAVGPVGITGATSITGNLVLNNSILQLNENRLLDNISSTGYALSVNVTTKRLAFHTGNEWVEFIGTTADNATDFPGAVVVGGATTIERDEFGQDSSLITRAIIYNTTDDRFQFFQAGSWTNLPNNGTAIGEVLRWNGSEWAASVDPASGTTTNSDNLGGFGPEFYLDYNNFTNTPTIPEDIGDLTDIGNLLFDGAYASLTGKPTLPTALSDLSNDVGFITAADLTAEFSFAVGADDSTLRSISSGESFKIIGGTAITTTSDAEGNITINGVAQDFAFASLTGTPTTLAGYGITDAATSAQGALADSAIQPADLGNFTFTGSVLDSSDSSAITITPAVFVSSDLTVQNDLTVTNKITVNTLEVENLITAPGAGTPELSSDTAILLTANTRVEVTQSPLKMASFTTAERDALSAENGDMIYNATTNKFQGYANGTWVDLH